MKPFNIPVASSGSVDLDIDARMLVIRLPIPLDDLKTLQAEMEEWGDKAIGISVNFTKRTK